MGIISVLGCGWLGLPLAKALPAAGHKVKGSVTDPERSAGLAKAGIRPYRVLVTPDGVEADDPDFWNTGVLILLLPPRRASGVETTFPAMIARLVKVVEERKIQKVLFTSSTSVYPEIGGVMTEQDGRVPEKPSGKALREAERLLTGSPLFRTTVLRFGGLIGADRNPARFLSREKGLVDGARPVNLIHRDDCIGIIREVIRLDIWGETFNACSPVHPARKEFYEKAAEVSGLPAPQFGPAGGADWKIVDPAKLINRLKYRFQYPSPSDWLE